jgi:hypothetical protein
MSGVCGKRDMNQIFALEELISGDVYQTSGLAGALSGSNYSDISFPDSAMG